jgi:hypothetical protein
MELGAWGMAKIRASEPHQMTDDSKKQQQKVKDRGQSTNNRG